MLALVGFTLSSFQFFWLLGLLALWAVLLFGGLAFGRPDPTRARRMPTWTRMASSLTLVVAAWSWYLFSRQTSISTFSLLLALGMTLGFLGDLLLAGVIPLDAPVLAGMGAFGLGHIAYIAAIIIFANAHGLTAALPRWGALALWLLIAGMDWYLLIYRKHAPTVLHMAALPYALLLASTAGFATGLAIQTPVFIPMALGATLFLSSDLLLGMQLFNKIHFPGIGDMIWLTYGPAQALIVYSVWSALAAG